VEKGLKQGRRPELQGGGLVRSAGGDTSVLFSKDKENRELSDQRILGGGDFVGAVLQESERLLEKKYKPKRTIDDLIAVVADKVGISPELICSGSRQRKYSEARALVAYMAVEETGHSAADVARYPRLPTLGTGGQVGVRRVNVLRSAKKGRKIGNKYDDERTV